MNEKTTANIGIIIFLCILVGFACLWTGFDIGKGTANTKVKELESKLSDIQALNTELQTENRKHIETIQRIQGLTDESARHIQLLESGIAELKRNGEAKDGRIVEAENRVRELSAEVDRLGEKINSDSEIIAGFLKEFGYTENSNNSGNINNSGVSWYSNNFNNYKVNKWQR